MRHIFFTLGLVVLLAGTAAADELYKVTLHSHSDAEALRNSGAEALAWIDGGYLVLSDATSSMRLEEAGLDIELLASGVSRDRLALDGRIDDKNARRFKVLYEDQGVRLLDVEPGIIAAEGVPEGIFPILNEHMKIEYYETRPLTAISVETSSILDKLVDEVSQDSIFNYVCSLQAYPYRVAGTANNLGARNWIYNKFDELGYTDIELDDFYRYFTYGTNVIAYKPGTLYPDRQVVIGAHFDAVANSPGADDNASGVACLLEIARILKDVDLPVTLIFVAFDAEEKGLLGAYHYVDEALIRGDDISFMQNMDMIGADGNDVMANMHHGPEIAFALLWAGFAETYSGIEGVLAGTSNRSDHYAFQVAGFDICSSREYYWSDVYHTPSDDITHMNFDYTTRMVKACLATVYTTGRAPGEVVPAALWQPGDGSSLMLHWHPANWPGIKEYRVGYFPSGSPRDVQYVAVKPLDTCTVICGLTEGEEYGFFVQGIDYDCLTSIPYFRCLYGIPQSVPVAPEHLLALPVLNGINLTWDKNNFELDLHHYDIFRDGEHAATCFDTCYTDLDLSLGTDFHTYYVKAVDTEDKSSDPSNTAEMRTATLDENRILAINRSGNHTIDFVSAYETEVFLLEAMEGYDYTYYCDTTATKYPFDLPQLDLVDMIDYGVLVIGAESGKYDEIGLDPALNGILDTIAYYMSIGGKLVVFGRWGNLINVPDTFDYLITVPGYDDAYRNTFHIDYRVLTPTIWPFPYSLSNITCDLIGAYPADPGYPQLMWDSAMTIIHSNAQLEPVIGTSGIPCASFVQLTSHDAEVVYVYDSRWSDPLSAGKPVAWRYLGPDGRYVWFDIPLSFFDREAAIQALRQAVEDVMGDTPTDAGDDTDPQLPNSFGLRQNYPNPFNPNTTVAYDLPRAADVRLVVYNLLGQQVRVLVDEYQTAGNKSVVWDGRNDSGQPVASGLYLYRIVSGEFVESKKMIMLK